MHRGSMRVATFVAVCTAASSGATVAQRSLLVSSLKEVFVAGERSGELNYRWVDRVHAQCFGC
jgi:hypothetical protein